MGQDKHTPAEVGNERVTHPDRSEEVEMTCNYDYEQEARGSGSREDGTLRLA